MTRRCVVGVLLLVGLMVGLALEPDSGTAARVGRPDVTGTTVGANHAKPLPRVTTVTDVVRVSVLATIVLVLLLIQLRWVSIVREAPHGDRDRSRLRALVRARRGPPALSFG
jgi:hypothetical protein